MSEYIPYDIDINTILLVNHRGNVIDVRQMCLEFNIYEDIYDSGIKCDLILSDSMGLIERLPIVGDETLIISFKTPTFERTRSLVFHVYSIQDRTKHKDRAYSYVVHGVSQEILNDTRRTVQGSYNRKISDLVEKIYENKLKPKQPEFENVSSRTRAIETEETLGIQSFIAPENTSPLAFIRFLQKHAMSSQHRASDYMFYQNTDGWHFRTLSSLLERDPVDSFYFTESSQEPDRDNVNLGSPGPDEPIRQYQKVGFVDYVNQFNLIDSYGEGLYHNTTEMVDPLRKRFEVREFKYDRDFDKLSHLSNNKYYTEDSPQKNVESTSARNFIVSEIGDNYRGLEYIERATGNDVRVTNPLRLKDFVGFMRAGMAQLNNIMINVGIPGNSDVKCGDVIRVYLQQGSIEKEYIGMNNILFGQKNPSFLVTAVRHSFNRERNQYSTIVQCTRDTYGIRAREFDV